jgi:4-hydroxy-2-oxoheptanedioate aldolase
LSNVNRAAWLDSAGAWSSLGSPFVADALARTAPDWIVLDAQHGRWDDAAVVAAFAVATTEVPMLVRVRSLDAGLVGRALDAGAAGVIAPMVQTVDDARELVRSTHYPPLGQRSFGPLRDGYGGETRGAACLAMIETRAAVDVVERIAAVEGLSGLFVGPFDLALSLGIALDELLADGAVLTAIARAAAEHGLVAGAFAGTPERAVRLRELGYTFVAATTEQDLLARGALAVARQLGAPA